jgi:hypothetical protein
VRLKNNQSQGNGCSWHLQKKLKNKNCTAWAWHIPGCRMSEGRLNKTLVERLDAKAAWVDRREAFSSLDWLEGDRWLAENARVSLAVSRFAKSEPGSAEQSSDVVQYGAELLHGGLSLCSGRELLANPLLLGLVENVSLPLTVSVIPSNESVFWG